MNKKLLEIYRKIIILDNQLIANYKEIIDKQNRSIELYERQSSLLKESNLIIITIAFALGIMTGGLIL